MSNSLAFSWFENLFCCKNENEISTENNTDQEEEREPFTRQENSNQENGEISPPPGQSKNGSHQNKVITEQPRKDSKAENKILFCCAGVCSICYF